MGSSRPRTFCQLLCLASLSLVVQGRDVSHKRPLPPKWPSTYTVSYTFSLPYIAEYQDGGMVYPVTVWHDATGKRYRMDTYGSENILIATKSQDIELVPRLNQTVCLIFDKKSGITDVGRPISGNSPVLPEISHVWKYSGVDEVNDESVNVWRYETQYQAKATVYTFYVRGEGSDAEPVRLEMHGQDLFSGSHYDEYLAEFTSFTPGAINSDVFEKPALCDGVKPGSRSGPSAFALRMQRLMPAAGLGGRDAEYDAFSLQHGRLHASADDYQTRLQVFRKNVDYISAWNAARNGEDDHTLAVNRFADWTEEEFLAVMLPQHGKEKHDVEHPEHLTHKPALPVERVPSTVDWRNTGADGFVKDQSACGSCWAFGGVGAMQSAWFLATGEEVLLSEQQLMDCSWGHTHNKACDGGLYEGAFDYLSQHSGKPMAALADYPYRGADGFCKDNTSAVLSSPYRFKGYKAIRKGDTADLKEALYTKGPLAISLDAAQPSFRFYSSGVYFDPACKWKTPDLDHAVMLMGYGSTEGGKDYWIVKNSWSKYWGDKGYIKISRDSHACGIATDALYAIADVEDDKAALKLAVA